MQVIIQVSVRVEIQICATQINKTQNAVMRFPAARCITATDRVTIPLIMATVLSNF